MQCLTLQIALHGLSRQVSAALLVEASPQDHPPWQLISCAQFTSAAYEIRGTHDAEDAKAGRAGDFRFAFEDCLNASDLCRVYALSYLQLQIRA